MTNVSNVEADRQEKFSQAQQTLLVSVNCRSQFFDHTMQKLANEDTFMEVAHNLVNQLLYHSKGPLIQANIKIRRLSPKERLIFELAS